LNLRQKLLGLAGVAAVALALATAASAGGRSLVPLPGLEPAPVLAPVAVLLPDLTVTANSPTSYTIKNQGRVAAGPFSLRISAGYVGDACGWHTAPILRSFTDLAAGDSITVHDYRPSFQSSTDRTLWVDYLQQVRGVERGEQLRDSARLDDHLLTAPSPSAQSKGPGLGRALSRPRAPGRAMGL
jgi:hypothetical protein